MAGSYGHCVNDDGKLLGPYDLNGMLTTGGDVWEAVEELFGMVWWLAAGDAERVQQAWEHYRDGLELSPGQAEDTTR